MKKPEFTTYSNWLFVLGIIATLGWFGWLASTQWFADPDAFYLLALAEQLWHNPWLQGINWLPYTQFANESGTFVDMHYLYHWWIAAWLWLEPHWLGMKVASVTAVGLLVLSLGLALKSLSMRYFWLLPYIVISISPLVFRLGLVKATALAWAVIGLVIIALHHKKYLWLMPFMMISALLYSGFPIIVAVVGVHVLALAIHDRTNIFKQHILPIAVYTTAGLAIGLLLHPAQQQLWQILWQQFIEIGVVNYQSSISVGGEWKPYWPSDLVYACGLPLLLVGVLCAARVARRLPWKLEHIWFGLLWLAMVVFTIKSRRYIEYSGVATALFLVALLNDIWPILKRLLYKFTLPYIYASIVGYIVVLLVIAITIPVLATEYRGTITSLRAGDSAERFAAAGEWLQHSFPDGGSIIQSDWDEFPGLVLHYPQGRYISGLDPTFTYLHSPEIYNNWSDLTLGQMNAMQAAEWLTTLNATAVVITQDHGRMQSVVDVLACSRLAWHSDEVVVFELTQPCK